MLKNSTSLFLSTVLIFGLSINSVLAQSNQLSGKQNTTSQTLQQHPWLGVLIKDVPASLGNHLSSILQKNQGVMVDKVHEDSPAKKAGIEEYDIIVQLNDQKIFSAQQLSQLVYNSPVNSKMTIDYIHQGKLQRKEIMLSARPEQAFSQRIRPNKIQPMPKGYDPFNDPFFNSHTQPNAQQFNSSQSAWSEFESLSIQSTGNNQYKVVVQYQDSNSDKKEFSFEGDMQQIQQQIEAADGMDEQKKAKLLDALANQGKQQIPFPRDFFQYPDWMNRHYSPFSHFYRP